jgi:hypothetical protein
MRRIGGGGLGFVVAVVVLLIVLLLSAKGWNMMLPKAAQAVLPAVAAAGTRSNNNPGNPTNPNDPPASATRPSGMPDLKEMGQKTDQHIQQVKDAAAKQD